MSAAFTVAVQTARFDPGAEMAQLAGLPDVGAQVCFVGQVRDFGDSQAVTALELEHYPGMTEKSLLAILGPTRRTTAQAVGHLAHIPHQKPGLALGLLLAQRLGLPLALDALQLGRPLLQRPDARQGRRLLLGNASRSRVAHGFGHLTSARRLWGDLLVLPARLLDDLGALVQIGRTHHPSIVRLGSDGVRFTPSQRLAVCLVGASLDGLDLPGQRAMRPGRFDHRRIALHQLGHRRRPLPLDFGAQLRRAHTLDALLFLAKLGSQQPFAFVLPLLLPPLALLGNPLVERLLARLDRRMPNYPPLAMMNPTPLGFLAKLCGVPFTLLGLRLSLGLSPLSQGLLDLLREGIRRGALRPLFRIGLHVANLRTER